MTSTLLSDVIIPIVYESYTAVNSPEKTAYVESGVVVRSEEFDNIMSENKGAIGIIPFWQDLDDSIEPNYSTENPADVAIPDKVTAGEMSYRKAYVNKGYSAGDLIMQLAGSSPMQRIRDRFGVWWQRQFQHRILALTLGLLAENIANDGADAVVSIASEDGNSAVAKNVFSRQAFTTSAFTSGDHFDDYAAIAVHSIIYKRMIDNNDIEFIKPSEGAMEVPTFLGRRVIVDDGMPVVSGSTSGFKYTSVLFKSGAIAYGEGGVAVPTEVYRRPDQGNGAGVEQLWERKAWLMHPFGYRFNSATISGGQSATLADLRLATNWNRVVPRKNIPVAYLVTNG